MLDPMQSRLVSPVRIVLADDHLLLLEGYRKLLDADFEVVGVAHDGTELLQAVSSLHPDIVVLDVGMPRLNGMEAARQIRRTAPETKMIFLTQQSSKPYIDEAFRCGASAYVLKQSASRELKQAILSALQGKRFVSADLSADTRRSVLTPRQLDILSLTAKRQTVEQISAALGLSVRTVEFHITAAMDEMGFLTRQEFRDYALSLE